MSDYSEDAKRLVLGDRNESYGFPGDDYAKTAKIWSGLLFHKLLPGVEITGKEAILMMAALKISREMHKHKPDNLIDAHGYLLCAEWVEHGKYDPPGKGETAKVPDPSFLAKGFDAFHTDPFSHTQ